MPGVAKTRPSKTEENLPVLLKEISHKLLLDPVMRSSHFRN